MKKFGTIFCIYLIIHELQSLKAIRKMSELIANGKKMALVDNTNNARSQTWRKVQLIFSEFDFFFMCYIELIFKRWKSFRLSKKIVDDELQHCAHSCKKSWSTGLLSEKQMSPKIFERIRAKMKLGIIRVIFAFFRQWKFLGDREWCIWLFKSFKNCFENMRFIGRVTGFQTCKNLEKFGQSKIWQGRRKGSLSFRNFSAASLIVISPLAYN